MAVFHVCNMAQMVLNLAKQTYGELICKFREAYFPTGVMTSIECTSDLQKTFYVNSIYPLCTVNKYAENIRFIIQPI